MIKNILLAIAFFIGGIGIGIIVFLALGNSSLRFDHPMLATLGIEKPRIVGFLPYWLLAKADKEYAQYLTTLTYFGLVVDADGKPIYLANPKEEEPGWTALKNGKFNSQDLPSSLLVHSADDEIIAELIKDPVSSAQALVSEIVPIMKSRGFDDLNLDIESFLEASESARANFTTFIATVAEEVQNEFLGTLTVEIPPIALVRSNLADPAAIGHIADYIVLMTYDYHYLGSMTAGAVAPVGGGGEILEFDVETAVQEAVKVIPSHKILLGIPLYGYEWETLRHAQGAPTIPGGASTASTRRIEELLAECATCSAQFDEIAKEPYLVYPENDYFNQIYYENETSMKEKISLAQRYQLGGVALWALGYEDSTILKPLEEYKKSFTVR